jgi:16S rRNA (uracil1498-N3)-methyltransferase
MHRFYVEMADGRPRFKRAQLHQIRNVLRLRDGERIAVFDGSGAEWIAQLREDSAEVVQTVDRPREPDTRLALYQALIKPARFEYVLQKGTEIGVARFVPFVAQRTIATGERLDRWRGIVTEAAEQSGRTIVPEVAPPLSFDDALSDATSRGMPFMPWEGVDRPRLGSVHRHCRDLALIVGPEGGFDQSEVDHARARGAIPVSLGRRILRSETAAIVAATLLFHLNGEL